MMKIETEELRDALSWVVEQFEKVLAGERAGNVVESLSYAKSLLQSNENWLSFTEKEKISNEQSIWKIA